MIALSRGPRLLIAIIYFIFICFLFVLPGSAFPSENWMSKIYFDKWVHIGIFFFFMIIWGWALSLTKKGMWWLLAIAIIYGILVEVAQDTLVPNRSFDLGDWIADIGGSLVGLFAWHRYIKK